MCACSGKFQYLQFVVVSLSVYQKPVWSDVALTIANIVTSQSMVFLFFWQGNIICQFVNDIIEFLNREISAFCQFPVFSVLVGSRNLSHHLYASR